METYNNFISQFEIINNPSKKKGFHRHHIVPVSEQVNPDNRQIYLTPAQHLWAHFLYDKENGTQTIERLLANYGVTKKEIKSYDDCLAFNDIDFQMQLRKSKIMAVKHKGENNPMFGRTGINNPRFGTHLTEEHRKHISETHWDCSGANHPMYGVRKYGEENPFYNHHHTEEKKAYWSTVRKGRKWFHNETEETQAFECPEGFIPGRLRRATN